MKTKSIAPVIAFILLVSFVHGLGIAPASKEIVFEPKTSQEITIGIINNEGKDLRLALIPKNELASFITVPDDVISISKDEYRKDVTYRIDLPEKLSPGTRIGEILIVTIGDDEDVQKDKLVSATVGVIHQLRVLVPYPDQYLQGSIYISEMQVKQPTTFTISLANLGQTDIKQVKGSIIITDPAGQGVSTLTTNEISLPAKGSSKVTASWDTNVDPGRYNVQVIIQYDDKVLLLSKEIDVGEPLLEIYDLRTYPFRLGTIAKLDILVKNKWNNEIKDAFSEVQISDASENPITSYKTSTVTVPPYGISESPVFWDTKGISEGTYKVNVKTYYLGRFSERLFETIVSQDSILVKQSQLSGKVVGTEGSSSNFIIFLVIVIVILLAIITFIARKKDRRTVPHAKASDNLYEYARKKLGQGYSPEALRKGLLEKGWNQEAIDSALLRAEEELDDKTKD